MLLRALAAGLFFTMFAWFPPAVPEVRAVVVDRIVATVDGAPITLFELERFIRLNGGVDPAGVSKEDQAQALELLIGETLVRLESRRLGLSVSQQDVDLYIEEIKRGNNLDDASLAEALGQQGFTVETYKHQIAKELLKNQLVMRQLRDQVQVSTSDVQKFYDENKEQFAKPGEIHLRQIFFVLPPNANEEQQRQVALVAQQAVTEIQSGKPFPAVAAKYSQGPEASDSGSLGWMKKGQMLPELEQLAFSLRKGQVGPPVRTAAGVHILSVDEMRASEYIPLSAVEGQITERLYSQGIEERFQDYVETDLMEGHSIVRRLEPTAVSQAPSGASGSSPDADDQKEQPSSTGDHAG